MTPESTIRRLPLMDGSLFDLEAAGLGDGWWTAPARLLPVVARPQLNQELEELCKFAISEGLVLVPVGSGSARLVGQVPVERPALLVQPGFATLFNGLDEQDRLAWLPAGQTLAQAEDTLNEAGYTLSLWPEDYGTVGGNWALPRGSFQVREFGAPADRRRGVQAFLGHGGWFKSLDVPASAAGPSIGKAAFGLGGRVGLVTQVLLSFVPQGASWSGHTAFDALAPLVRALRELLAAGHRPTSLSLRADDDGWLLCWRQNVWNGWAERTVKAAARALDLRAGDCPKQRPSAPGGVARRLPWSDLSRLATDEGAARQALAGVPLAGLDPEGLWAWDAEPRAPSAHWAGWLATAADCHFLTQGEGEA